MVSTAFTLACLRNRVLRPSYVVYFEAGTTTCLAAVMASPRPTSRVPRSQAISPCRGSDPDSRDMPRRHHEPEPALRATAAARFKTRITSPPSAGAAASRAIAAAPQSTWPSSDVSGDDRRLAHPVLPRHDSTSGKHETTRVKDSHRSRLSTTASQSPREPTPSNHPTEAVRGLPAPHNVGGSRPRVVGWPEGRSEPPDWRRDNALPHPRSDPWVGL